MSFDYDAFISYSHIDNLSFVTGAKGWVTKLHEALVPRVAQVLGEMPNIWRDPDLSGNEVFEAVLTERLQKVAVLITVVSPRYIKSEWTRRELLEFSKAAAEQGGLNVHNKARIFKVIKTPIPRELDPPELQPLLGYEFFGIDAENGLPYEFDKAFGTKAQVEFNKRVNDLAYGIVDLLKIFRTDLQSGEPWLEATAQGSVFLAEATSDLREERDAIRRDLQQHGYRVLPEQSIPLSALQMRELFEQDLSRCRMSVHLIGGRYGLIPEESSISLQEIQNELAIERGKQGGFVRLVWIRGGLQTQDERQLQLIQRLRTDPRIQAGADLLETGLEELKTVVHRRLLEAQPQSAQENVSATHDGTGSIYFVYDERDSAAVSAYDDASFKRGFEVLHPSFEGDETDVRLCHEESLRVCDGVLIFFGSANEGWVRRKLREIEKSVGYGRTKALPVVTIARVGAKTCEKERFRTHGAEVLPLSDGLTPDMLEPFWSRVGH